VEGLFIFSMMEKTRIHHQYIVKDIELLPEKMYAAFS